MKTRASTARWLVVSAAAALAGCSAGPANSYPEASLSEGAGDAGGSDVASERPPLDMDASSAGDALIGADVAVSPEAGFDASEAAVLPDASSGPDAPTTPDAVAPADVVVSPDAVAPADASAACTSGGFAATAVNYALPPSYGTLAFAEPYDTIVCSPVTRPTHSVIDLTGDGVPDLVVTQACADTLTGTSRWRVYRGTPTGFAPTPLDYALPSGYGSNAFVQSADTVVCNSVLTRPTFSTMDVTGDHVPDLVVTQACADTLTGTSRWRVYRGTPTGFAPTPLDFALPPGYGSNPFVLAYDTVVCNSLLTRPTHAVMDLTGDGLLDLVATQACADTLTGTSRWRVYRGTPTGFAPTPLDYALPTGYGTLGFAQSYDTIVCSPITRPTHGPMDLDGDGLLDMVVTQACADTLTGTSRWRVYRGTPTGFAPTPLDYALPPSYGTLAFAQTTDTIVCSPVTRPTHSTLDLTGDRVPDMVVTQACSDTLTGTSRWRVYRGTPTGFASTPLDYALPPSYGTLAFAQPYDTIVCSPVTRPTHSPMDLTGDHIPDMVLTQACSDTLTGTSRWLLFAGRCAP